MTRWEYRTVDGPMIRGDLNDLGAVGWELVAITGSAPTWVFKRQVAGEEIAAEDPKERGRQAREQARQLRSGS